MKIGNPASWDRDVFPCWRRAAKNRTSPNSDVWRPLPAGVRWFEGIIETRDIPLIYLIGSPDLYETFGSYRLAEIGREMPGEDKYHHRRRIREISKGVEENRYFERPIAVAESEEGPYILLDGNHRCLGYHCEGKLENLAIYLGLVPRLIQEFKWAWHLR
jgi:hypothetical protein